MCKKIIFIVDDDPFQHTLMDYIISKQLKNPKLHFYDGIECLEKIGLKPKIIFLDYEMVELNGIETLKKIKEYNSEILVVFISSQQDQTKYEELKALGAFEYIVKDENMYQNLKLVINKIKRLFPEIIE